MRTKLFFLLTLLPVSFSGLAAGPVFMSDDWAQEACSAWNNDKELVNGLAGKWIGNDGGRGFKVIQIYRTDCGADKIIELTIEDIDGGAKCSYGGPRKHIQLDSATDYLMYATDEDWVCMGEGKWGCGPMGAMATGKLKFEGPKMEAMGVMGPFENFLLLTGKVASERGTCP